MKTKSMRRMAAAMAVVIATGMAANCGYQRNVIIARAADVNTNQLLAASNTTSDKKSSKTEESGITKEESVYVKADTSGKVKSTTVTEWLKNTGNGTLADTSDLKDIKNIKGDEEFQTSGSDITWTANGDDIYYQGTSDKELPVGVSITYKLDGKEISAEDLKGKDGKVEIHIKYTNKSKETKDVNGTDEELFTPFTMITAMLLPADKYENVQIDNGKVISDAERQIVVGVGFPGLQDSLNLEDSDIEIPEEVTITADVKDASIEPSITVATTDFLQDVDLDDMDELSDLSESMDELDDATNQLVDGSQQAADGASQLAEGAGTLKDGTSQLAAGVSTLVSKIPTLVSGVTALDNGASSLQTGVGTLQASVDHKAQSEEDQSGLVEGAETLNDGVNDYTNGVANMQAKMEAGKMTTGAETLARSASQLAFALTNAQTGVNDLKTASTNMKQLTDGIKQAVAGMSQQVAALRGTVVVNSGFEKSVSEADVIDTEALSVALSNAGLTDEQKTAVMEAVKNNTKSSVAVTTDDLKQAAADGKITASVNTTGVQTVTGTLSELSKNASALATGIDTGVTTLKSNMDGDGTAENPGAVAAANQMAAGAKSLSAGVKDVKDGVDLLASSNTELQTGAGALATGAQKLSAGVATLSEGVASLKAGTTQLSTGAGALATGANTLGSGVSTLDEGAGTLKDGIEALAEGNQTLAEGMAEYKAEAIDKLTSMFRGDITKIADRLQAMTELGQDYKSYAGIKDGMNGSTKFIIETEGIDD